MSKFKSVLFILSMSFGGAAAGAENVEDRMAVMNAQIELLRKQMELNQALQGVAGTTTFGMPVVISVSQMGDSRLARLQMPSGAVGYYREGDVLNSNMVLSAIGDRQVFVRVARGKKKTILPLEFHHVNQSPDPSPQGSGLIPEALLPLPPQVSVPAIDVAQAAAAIPAVRAAVVAPTPTGK